MTARPIGILRSDDPNADNTRPPNHELLSGVRKSNNFFNKPALAPEPHWNPAFEMPKNIPRNSQSSRPRRKSTPIGIPQFRTRKNDRHRLPRVPEDTLDILEVVLTPLRKRKKRIFHVRDFKVPTTNQMDIR